MQAFKITFHLASDMAYPSMPLHLDALLAYAVTQDNLITLDDNATNDDILALSDDMPIEKHEQDGEWVYKASALIPEGPMTHSRQFYTQRQDVPEMASLVAEGKVKLGRYKGEPMPPMSFKNKVDTTRGHQRNLLGYFNTTSVRKLIAYCVADGDFLEEYLIDSGWITHIGGRRRQGLGQLSHIDIEEDDSGFDMWQQRIKPFSLADDDTPIMATCRPPYWDQTKVQKAFIPCDLA